MRFLLVAIGGGLGALLRYVLTLRLHAWLGLPAFPYGTLAANVLGCLAIGAAMAAFAHPRSSLPPALQLALVTGLLGGLTTFSSFGYESLDLLERGLVRHAVANVAANVVLGFSAVAVGRAAVRAWIGA